MKNGWSAVVRLIAPTACIGVIAALFCSVRPLSPLEVGRYAAAVGAALSHPKESALYMSEHLVSEQSTAQSLSLPFADSGAAAETAAHIIPPKGDGGGTVSEQNIEGGTPVVGKVSVKNHSGVSFAYADLFEKDVLKAATDGPQVLIAHTHATECYMSYYAGYYNEDDRTRTTDNTANVTAVGEALAQELRACGIGVVHATDQHDHPEYTGAYVRSEETIQRYLKEYPSIRVVLDVHRDAILQDDLTKVKPTVTVDGCKAAQVMVVVGATDTEELPNAYCKENVGLGLQLHHAMEEAYEGIMRPLYLVDARYNQGLLAGSLLLEVGTDANTLSEALYSGRLVGKQLALLLGGADS
ncbi:MAG: stage II sporulation protein P [Clostridia bacterium]|nr:stage II sporulation protein P [Clostridia bacterium]